MRKLLLYFIISGSLFSAKAQTSTDEVLIRTYREASNIAIAKHDINGIAVFWLPNFVVVRGNGTSLTGKDAIIANWKEIFNKSPEVKYIRNPTEISISENHLMAWEKGVWIGINTYSRGGNYAATWCKVEGVWKLQAEMFVSLK